MTRVIQIMTNTSFDVDFNANGTSYRMAVIFNAFNDSYFFNLYQVKDLQLILSGITMSTGTDLLQQFPNWFKLWIVPTRPELYSSNPNSRTIRGYQIWVEDNE